jgi:DivIVA domain-containing protein
MAMSFSRPDPSSPTSIADASFGTSRRGFDQTEVKDFLRMVAAEFGRLRERERFLERELSTAQNHDGAPATIDEDLVMRLLGEEAVRVLTTARESANEIREKAEQAAARLLSEAGDEASRVREEADIEASRRRADAAADAEAEVSMAKQQGREMVNEARAYRERVLSELARRRELAREQIEQLVHGRDRLMQAFERARLVAVDVVAEMQPLGEPDEYVNLTPTTGPLPVMIANSPRPDEARHSVEQPDAGVEVVIPADGGDLRIVDDADQADEIGDDESGASVADIDGELESVDGDVATEDDAAVDSREGEPSDETPEAAATAQDDTSDDESSSDDSGDVVVDLFARLRADASPVDTTDAEPANGDDQGGDEQLDTPESATVADGNTDADVADVEAADDAPPTAFEMRDIGLAPLIVSTAKKLKRSLADEQNDVLDALRRSEAVHNIDTLLPWASEHAGRYAAAIADEILEAVHLGSATSRLGDRPIRKALATESVAAVNDALEQWLVMPLRDRLARCITEGNGDNAVVTKKVRAVYREWKTQHIDDTLDDVLRCAHGRGVLAGFTPDTPIVWEVDERAPACPDCEDNMLAGAVAAGASFPTGDLFAPAHQGCRCLLAAADR